MNIQAINNTIINSLISKDNENDIVFYGFRTPYQEAIEDLDRKFHFELERLESSFFDKNSKERSMALNNFWKEKENAEMNVKKEFGLISNKTFIQKLFKL